MFFFKKCTFERRCTDTEVIPQFWLFYVIFDQFLYYFYDFTRKNRSGHPKMEKMAFFHFIFFEIKKNESFKFQL